MENVPAAAATDRTATDRTVTCSRGSLLMDLNSMLYGAALSAVLAGVLVALTGAPRHGPPRWGSVEWCDLFRSRFGGWTLGQGAFGRGVVMRACVGDRLYVHGRVVGTRPQMLEIVEIRGSDGAPPYLVRRDDGHEVLMFPGPDASVEHPESRDLL